MITPLILVLAGYAAGALGQEAPAPAPAAADRTDRIVTGPLAVEARRPLVPEAEVEAEAPAAPVAALAALPDEAVFAAAAEALQRTDTLQARFVQTAPSGEVSTGRLYLDRPGRLRLDYDAPSAQRIVATNGLVYVQDTELETIDTYPVGQTPLRFLLPEEIDTSGAVLTGVERAPGEVAVTMEAADADLSGQVALVFDVADDEAMTLSRWAVFDPRGGVTVVALDEVETGGRLRRDLFRAPKAEDPFLDRR